MFGYAGGRQDVAAVLSDREVVQCVWEVATSRGVQYRMQMHFIQVRQAFIQNGTPARMLPLTDELQLRLEEESRASAQDRGRPEGEEPPIPGETTPDIAGSE